ncbi:MAG: response regulator [Taibaiella sp.]|nr:response regulator [Taibaiella sp.]
MREQILIVDDDPVISKLLEIIMSEKYSVICKQNGIEAFRWLEEGNFPDLIISDLQMPYLDGSSFVRNLKISGFYEETPVVVLSGSEDMQSVIQNMPFTVDGTISKPFNPTLLKETISNILNAKRTHAAS